MEQQEQHQLPSSAANEGEATAAAGQSLWQFYQAVRATAADVTEVEALIRRIQKVVWLVFHPSKSDKQRYELQQPTQSAVMVQPFGSWVVGTSTSFHPTHGGADSADSSGAQSSVTAAGADLDVTLCGGFFGRPDFDPNRWQVSSVTKIQKVRNALQRDGQFTEIQSFLLHSSVPVLRFRDLQTSVRCDLSFNNLHGVWNSRVLQYLANQAHPVARALISFVREWAKRRGIHGASRGYFSTYALTIMVFYSFQRCTSAAAPRVPVLNLAELLPKLLSGHFPVGTAEAHSEATPPPLGLELWQPKDHHQTDVDPTQAHSSSSSGRGSASGSGSGSGSGSLSQALHNFLQYFTEQFHPERDCVSLRQPVSAGVALTKAEFLENLSRHTSPLQAALPSLRLSCASAVPLLERASSPPHSSELYHFTVEDFLDGSNACRTIPEGHLPRIQHEFQRAWTLLSQTGEISQLLLEAEEEVVEGVKKKHHRHKRSKKRKREEEQLLVGTAEEKKAESTS